jgi:PAS domain S-box-containing protein
MNIKFLILNLFICANSYAQDSNKDTLFFLGNKNIAPVIYLEDNTPSGVAVDIVNALAKHIAQPVEIKAIDWQEAQTLVARGKADALIQINQTEERLKIYDFSDPLLESQFSIFVHTDRVGISGISSLRGLRVGVESGGLPRQILEKNPHISLTLIPNFLQGFKQLNEGNIDAVVVDYRVGSYILAQYNIRDIKVSGEPIAYSYSSLAVKKGNAKLLNAINAALRIIKADGTYEKIISKWKPKEVVFHTREQIKHLIYNITIPALLLLFLIVVIWMATLRKELSKRKTAEERLREEHITLRSIINSVNALIFSVDRQYCYTSFNQQHAITMNMLYGVEIKLGFSILDYLTVLEDQETAKRNLDRALAGEQLVEESYSGEELRSRRYFQVSHSPIRTESGEIIGVAMLAKDMTERKRAEIEILMLNQELEQRVADRTFQLEASNKELEAFAYSVSHDLRAPLRHIDGFIELLKMEIAANLNEQGHHYMTVISDSAKRMGSLIDDLLSFSRMGRSEISKRQVDLNKLIQDVIQEFNPETEGRTILWQISDLPIVTGDKAMLRIVFINLISNALKFTRKREQAEIEIGFTQDKEAGTVIFVQDNGVGFDPEYANKLFGVFQRLHRAEEFEGTGIGLANVRRIIVRHGGRTWAEGEIGKGATFYFLIP